MLLSVAVGQIFAGVSTDTIAEYSTSGATVNPSLVGGLYRPDGIAVSGSDLFVVNEGIGTVSEYTTSGALVNSALISGLYLPTGITISGSDLFVLNGGLDQGTNGSIAEYTTSGAVVNPALVTGLTEPAGIVVSGSDLFVTEDGDFDANGLGTIGEFSVSGTTVNASLVTGLSEPLGIVGSGSDIFFENYSIPQDSYVISEITTGGALVNADLVSIPGLLPLGGLAISGSNLFITGSDADNISEYTTSGVTVNASLVTGLNFPLGVATDGADLFVVNGANFANTTEISNIIDTIGEYAISGATVNASLISGLNVPLGIADSGSNLFATTGLANTVGEYSTSGATVNASLITGLDDPNGIALSGSDLFIVNSGSGTIGEYTTDGATVNPSLVSGLNNPVGIAISGTDIFVTNETAGTIGEYTTAGATVDATLVSGLSDPYGIAVSGSDLLVTNESIGTVGEYTTGGATVNASLISGLGDSKAIAVSGSDLFVASLNGAWIGEYTTSGVPVNEALIAGLNDALAIYVTPTQAETTTTATHLAFGEKFMPSTAGQNLTSEPTVELLDSSNHLVADDNSVVALALFNANGATLNGTVSVQAVNGVATFPGLSIDNAGSYSLLAMDGALTSVTSKSFPVAPDSSTAQLAVVHQPNATTVGLPLTSGLTVDVEDQFGNVIKTDHSKVTLSIISGPTNGALSGVATVAVNKGVAIFSKNALSAVGTYTLSVSDAAAHNNSEVQFTQVIKLAITTAAVPHPAASYTLGQTISLSSTFKSNAPTSVPFTQLAGIYDGNGDLLGTAPIAANGAVKFNLATTNAGQVQIPAGNYSNCTIRYGGDSSHSSFTSGTFTLLIKQAATKVTLQSSATSLASGQSLTLTAGVASNSTPSVMPTGMATFLDNGSAFDTLTLTGGAAALTLVPTLGIHSYSVSYSGDTNFLASSGAAKSVTDDAPLPSGNVINELSDIGHLDLFGSATYTRGSQAGQTIDGLQIQIDDVDTAGNITGFLDGGFATSYVARSMRNAKVTATGKFTGQVVTSVVSIASFSGQVSIDETTGDVTITGTFKDGSDAGTFIVT